MWPKSILLKVFTLTTLCRSNGRLFQVVDLENTTGFGFGSSWQNVICCVIQFQSACCCVNVTWCAVSLMLTADADRSISTYRVVSIDHRRYFLVCRTTLPSTCGVSAAYWSKCILANRSLPALMRHVDVVQEIQHCSIWILYIVRLMTCLLHCVRC